MSKYFMKRWNLRVELLRLNVDNRPVWTPIKRYQLKKKINLLASII